MWKDNNEQKHTTDLVIIEVVDDIKIEGRVWNFQSTNRFLGYVTYSWQRTQIHITIGIGRNLSLEEIQSEIEQYFHKLPIITWKPTPDESEIDGMLEGNER